MREELQRAKVGGLTFIVRANSSDLKTLREVVHERTYERRGFPIGGSAQTWVDFGANIGAFTCLVAARGSSVVAYEPDPDSYQLLRQNVVENGLSDRVQCVQAAVVTDLKRTEVVLHRNSKNRNYWRNSIVRTWRGGESVKVPARHYLSALEPGHRACLKMDIEGAEMELLEDLMSRPADRLVFEWSFDVDPDILRFKRVIEKLRGWYSKVEYAAGFEQNHPTTWQPSWNPPCRTIWCSDA